MICTKVDYVLLFVGDGSESESDLQGKINAVDEALITNSNMFGLRDSSTNKQNCLSLLCNTSIFAFIGHGNIDKIYFTAPNVLTPSNMYVDINDINSLPDTAFNNLEFVYLGACDTGMGEENGDNLINAIYDKGAGFVLGFVHNVDQKEANYWSEQFMISLSQGNTIENAMSFADTQVRNNFTPEENKEYTTTSQFRYYRGNVDRRPCA